MDKWVHRAWIIITDAFSKQHFQVADQGDTITEAAKVTINTVTVQ